MIAAPRAGRWPAVRCTSPGEIFRLQAGAERAVMPEVSSLRSLAPLFRASLTHRSARLRFQASARSSSTVKKGSAQALG